MLADLPCSVFVQLLKEVVPSQHSKNLQEIQTLESTHQSEVARVEQELQETDRKIDELKAEMDRLFSQKRRLRENLSRLHASLDLTEEQQLLAVLNDVARSTAECFCQDNAPNKLKDLVQLPCCKALAHKECLRSNVKRVSFVPAKRAEFLAKYSSMCPPILHPDESYQYVECPYCRSPTESVRPVEGGYAPIEEPYSPPTPEYAPTSPSYSPTSPAAPVSPPYETNEDVYNPSSY